MAISLAIIVLLGIIIHQLFVKVKLPGFLGILFLGMAIGPYGLDWIDETILNLSEDLRKIALIIILLRAGLGLNRYALKMVGKPAVRLGFLPLIAEGFTIMLVAGYFLELSISEAGMLGFIVAAVSPAVIVPKMLSYMKSGKGEEKGIPAMILAGASIDDVVAITIFSSFAGIYTGEQLNIAGHLIVIPLSILTGILAGLTVSLSILYLFKKFKIRHTKKLLVILAMAIFLTSLEDILENIVPISSLLGVMVIGIIIMERKSSLAMELSARFEKVWVFAEIFLFFLVGMEVNFYLALDAGLIGTGLIFTGLIARSAGVWLSLIKTKLSSKEKGFCILAYSPKATVQAAIGSIPLTLGAPAGELILAIAVLSIIVTAPFGAISMNIAGKKVFRG